MSAASHPRLVITSGEVQVWRAALQEDARAGRLEPLLSPDEVHRADRFRFPQHRRRFVIARGCLRQLLGAYLGIQPGDVVFAYSDTGKPELDAHHESDISFNVSHSGDIAGFAFTTARQIGVDVEMIRYDIDVEEIPKRFFSPLEQQMLSGLEDKDKYRGFFNCWTRKEAYVKAEGSGLSLPLRDFDVSLLPGHPARLLATRPDPSVAAQWNMASLDFGEDCVAAVVVEGILENLEIWPFPEAGENAPR